MADALFITLKTQLEALRFQAMEGSEEMSRLFDYSVLAVAKPTDTVKFEDLLGTPAQVNVSLPQRTKRIYHGLITGVAYEGHVGSLRGYRLTVRPWLWLATRASNVRVFQKQKVVDILKKVLQPYGGTIADRTQTTRRARDYCVQYRESDFNFVSRLMEEEGIFYFFEHAENKHSLVLADSPSAHVAMQGLTKLPFNDTSGPEEAITRWRWSEQLQTTKVKLREYVFQRPPTPAAGEFAASQRTHAHKDALVAYDAPATLATYPDEPSAIGRLNDETAAMARVRVQEMQARYALADGDTTSINLCVGARIKLEKHPLATQNGEYAVLSTRVQMRMPAYEGTAADVAEHHCQFIVLPAQVPFRPARTTPKPTVPGPHTALVVGPSGQEIYTDKYGRVKVQFPWDLEGEKNANSSCFVRVAQASAGKGWGAVFLPRIGHEVVVTFLEGDPDQPLITGSVYNADNMPPYVLPDNKTVSTLKTRSSPKGGAEDFNELRFEDKKDSELLLLQAQKDKIELVKNISWTEIRKDQHVSVKGDRKEKVEGEHHLNVVKDVLHKFDAKLNLRVAKDVLIATDGLHALKAAKDITAEAGTAYSIKAGTDLHVKAGKNTGIDSAVNVHVKGGVNVVVEAGVQLTLKAGPSSVVLGPDGVSITGPLVKVNSGGGPGSGSGASPVAPTAPADAAAAELPQDPMSHA